MARAGRGRNAGMTRRDKSGFPPRFPSSRQLSAGNKAFLAVGGVVMSAAMKFIGWSSKVEILGWEKIETALAGRRPLLFAFWHGGIVNVLIARYHVQLPFLVTMISRSKDGEMAAHLARAFGTEAVRASSSKGGAAGLMKFRDYLAGGEDEPVIRTGFHVVDGPRGPRLKIKPGIFLLARQSNALIIPLSIGNSRRWVARSWDRHRIPLPFGRCVYNFGEPIDPSDEKHDNMTTEDLEHIFADLASSNPLCARDEAII